MNWLKVKPTTIPGYSATCPWCGVKYSNSSEGVVRQNLLIHSQARHLEQLEQLGTNADLSETRKRRGKKAKIPTRRRKQTASRKSFRREGKRRLRAGNPVPTPHPRLSEPKPIEVIS